MANNIQWKPTTFTSVKVDPAGAFADAASVFSSLQKNITDKADSEARARFRDEQTAIDKRRMAWAEGAPQRAIDEEQRKLQQSIDKGLFAEEAAKQAGGSRVEGLMAAAMADPRYQGMEDIEGKIMDFAENNKAMVSDPKTYRDSLMKNLVSSGKMSYEDAQTIAEQKTSELFPVASDEMIGKMLTALGKAPGYSGSGGSTGKDATPGRTLSSAALQDMTKELAARRDLPLTPDNIPLTDTRLDVGKVDATLSDLDQTAARLQAAGVTDVGAIRAALDEAFHPVHAGKLKDKYDFTTKKGFENLVEFGRQQQAVQGRKTGAANAAARGDYLGAVNQIVSRGTRAKMSDEELLNEFFNSLNQVPQPKPTDRTNPTAGDNATKGTPNVLPTAQDQQAPPVQVDPAAAAAAQPQGVLSPLADPQSPTVDQASTGQLLSNLGGRAVDAVVGAPAAAGGWLADQMTAVPTFENVADQQEFIANLTAKANADFDSLTPFEKIWVTKLGIQVKR